MNSQSHGIFSFGPALMWLCCVTMIRLLTLSGPQPPRLKNGDGRWNEDPAFKLSRPLPAFLNLLFIHSFIH